MNIKNSQVVSKTSAMLLLLFDTLHLSSTVSVSYKFNGTVSTATTTGTVSTADPTTGTVSTSATLPTGYSGSTAATTSNIFLQLLHHRLVCNWVCSCICLPLQHPPPVSMSIPASTPAIVSVAPPRASSTPAVVPPRAHNTCSSHCNSYLIRAQLACS